VDNQVGLQVKEGEQVQKIPARFSFASRQFKDRSINIMRKKLTRQQVSQVGNQTQSE
jgi:hypothetical protein